MSFYKIKRLFLVPFFAIFIFIGCKESEYPAHLAMGHIIGVTGGCYGDIVVIEVDTPNGIGESGTFSTWGDQQHFEYENAIGVPYFSKLGLPESIPQTVGTRLYFEYRELTEEERNNSSLFFSYNGGCPLNIIPPQVKRMIITRIIRYR